MNGLAGRRRNRFESLRAYKFSVRGFQVTEQACIVDSDSQLIGHRLQSRQVFVTIGQRVPTLHRHSPKHLIAYNQRQGYLRARQGQIRMTNVLHVQRDKRLAAGKRRTD